MNIKVGKYTLDKQQSDIVLDESERLLVVAGAGSGKTLTILGKIDYLVKNKNINEKDILCISFTNASCESLHRKIRNDLCLNVEVLTFHKLAINILKSNKVYFSITGEDMLSLVIHDFFEKDILNNEYFMRLCLFYFDEVVFDVRKGYLSIYKKRKKDFVNLERLISTFLHLFKCNNYNLSDFILFNKKSKRTFSYRNYKKRKIFFIFAMNIYLIYMDYLKENEEMDFDDVIIRARQVLESGVCNSYKYVIIDEYQDTSFIRFLLVKSILDKTNAGLMVVGDDFQSIYRFTGCDISLFCDFKKFFSKPQVKKIESTYRNSNELIKVAGNFVMKNKRQIRKNLTSNISLEKPIKVVYYSDVEKTFYSLVKYIYGIFNGPIMVLGRNNSDIKLVIGKYFKMEGKEIVCVFNKDIKLYFMTVHKSKGLEEENVIIINLRDDILGFPSKIKNDSILDYVSVRGDNFPFSEERRLFYVALTRTKNYVFLLVPKGNESIFVKEIMRYKKYVQVLHV